MKIQIAASGSQTISRVHYWLIFTMLSDFGL